MKAPNQKTHRNAHFTRGLLDWVLVVLAGICLMGGIRKMFNFKAQDSVPIRSEIFSQETKSPKKFLGSTVASWRDQTRRIEIVNPLASRLAKLIQTLQAEADSMNNEQLINELVEGMRVSDIRGALDILGNAEPTNLAMDLSQRLVRRWSENNPQEVAEWIKRLPSGSQRQAALDNLALVWANCQMTDAISWGQSLTDVDERNRALTAVTSEIVRTDPITALKLAISLPAASQRDSLVCRAVMDWAAGSGQDAAAWAEQISDDTLRVNALAVAAVAWSTYEPEAAAILAVEKLPSGRLQADTVVSIVQRWAQLQPEAAAAWVMQFPEGSLREAAVKNLFVQWSKNDSAKARQWLAEISCVLPRTY